MGVDSSIFMYSSTEESDLKTSATWGWVNLTNNEINYGIFSHYDNLIVQGRLYHAPTGNGYDHYTISLKIDGIVYSQYNNITEGGGYFTINNYSIPEDMNIYSSHIFEVNVSTTNTVDYLNYFTIYLNSTSEFYNVAVDTSKPYLTGENIDISGALRYDNNSNILNANIDASWYTDLGTFVSSSIHSTGISGTLPGDIKVPINPLSLNNMTLNITYIGNPNLGGSHINFSKILVFEDAVFYDLPLTPGDAGSVYIVSGRVLASSSPNFPIENRYVRVIYNNGEVITPPNQTQSDGSFSITFTIPSSHNGSYSYYVELVNFAGKTIVSLNRTIAITPLSPVTGGFIAQGLLFAEFLIIFIPIISVIGGLFVLYGYYFLKKQRDEAQVASIPLEGKIKNLKILKDSGRLEESLSYLFNAIFITLVAAKFGRKKKEFETIRDFAIISVKELKMKPSIIYPFITKVEEIIYSKPFEITDKDFYTVVDLFSRVYFELTNYNFILNF